MAESLSLSQKKGRRKIGTCSQRRKILVFDPAALLMNAQSTRIRKVDVSFSRSPKTLIFLIILRDLFVRTTAVRPCRGHPSRMNENDPRSSLVLSRILDQFPVARL